MARTSTDDPLAPLAALPGVPEAVARARDATTEVHNQPVNRRGWPTTAAEAALRAARSSAALDGAPLSPATADHVSDPVLAGAVRIADERARLLEVWGRAPLQALARLHVLAATDLVPAAEHEAVLGRPRPGASARLSALADLIGGGTTAPAPVLVAVVHGELLTLRPFGTADGVVARAAARLTAMSSGLDPRGLSVPEVGFLRRPSEYRAAAEAFATGTADGLARWIAHTCDEWEAGGREGLSIAAAQSG
ncbi:putative oxidoreductase [Pseudonocardia sp. Ae168_Ps1]|uniref:oxidoreductase n=1 Tax=unclassified Pseudonocardia TaxID=2619320 RepID=UPI00094B35AD|nr:MULTISPECIES: oxidoreductase [unclassified Pseudonocardia]OLL75284.1 putative oxidoreductase [Pseudonocardia sp. Ae150A_Ps1]OLL81280.1 putative oxidoreductase [Pseudonocardia sp. Ae168_Ps1]OLL84607.1 putative oxidoreductase [Pseudonocardia sp. Ae263_Ps1]OLL95374.1 putative oxidoreductase [Pseudonocardia sp. Ae356_Ps1]